MPFTSETAHTGTQFPPGKSGNPAGKPKGTKHLSTWIQELLNDEKFETIIIDAKKGIIEYKGAPIKAILNAQIQMALHSKDESIRLKAMDLMGKYGFGTKLELANNPDNPINGAIDPTTAIAFAEFLKKK